MKLGILGGTSFLETEILRNGERSREVTPYGVCDVVTTGSVAMISRHGGGTTPPHRINHYAHIKAMKQIGVDKIVSFGSVGALRPEAKPGTLMVVDDWYMPWRVVTYHHDELRYTVPGFDPFWRGRVLEALEANGLAPRDGGVYAETLGPQFETTAEVMALLPYADVIGMTCASEAILAQEMEIPLVVLAMVDNYANGIGVDLLTDEAFKRQVAENRANVLRAFETVVKLADE